jgi:hypothetical protein
MKGLFTQGRRLPLFPCGAVFGTVLRGGKARGGRVARQASMSLAVTDGLSVTARWLAHCSGGFCPGVTWNP